jgi:hypothetical protein
MRAITTNWNNAAYALEATFVDKVTGNAVVVPALNPMNHRSMVDSVEAGAYVYQPDSIVADPATLALAPEDTDEVAVTITLDSVPVSGVAVLSGVDFPEFATVSPSLAYKGDDGVAVFTVTAVDDGVATVIFTCGTITDDTEVTVTTPE